MIEQMADGIGLRETTKDRDPEAVRVILEALPGWFGDPDAVNNYVAAAADERYTSILARGDGSVLGVALVDRHFPESAELHLIAVAPHARGRGVGRALVEHVARDLAADGCCFLSVHTVGPSFENESYAHTRAFYRSVGFAPLEEHTGLEWSGPTLILVRALSL